MTSPANTVALEDFDPDLARRVEAGETIVVTRAGRPVADLVPHRRGLDLEAGAAFLRARGITDPFPFIADDFDDPLDEDFLLKPLPE